MHPHSHLVNKFLIDVGDNLPDLTLWKNPTGAAYSKDSVDKLIFSLCPDPRMASNLLKKLQYIKYGLNGGSDTIGIRKSTGKFVGCEMKTGNAKQNKDQINFMEMVLNHNAEYYIIRENYSLLDLVK